MALLQAPQLAVKLSTIKQPVHHCTGCYSASPAQTQCWPIQAKRSRHADKLASSSMPKLSALQGTECPALRPAETAGRTRSPRTNADIRACAKRDTEAPSSRPSPIAGGAGDCDPVPDSRRSAPGKLFSDMNMPPSALGRSSVTRPQSRLHCRNTFIIPRR